MDFKVEIKLMSGHEKGVVQYYSKLIKWLIRCCDKEAERAREDARSNNSESNIKCYGRCSTMKARIFQMRSIKEILRVIDSKKEERKQAQKKLACKVDFIDLEARNLFAAGKVTTSITKCASGFNYYGLRHAMINDNIVEATCLQCNQVKIQDYVVRCREIIELRKEFMHELLTEMLKVKDNKVCINTIIVFGEDILEYLECEEEEEEEEEEECETSQWMIRMKKLFQGCITKVWIGADMSSDKHRKLNKIAVRKCVKYYAKCWKYRNKVRNDTEK